MLHPYKTLPGHQNPVYALAGHGGLFYSAGNDKGIVEWTLEPPAFRKVKFAVQHTLYCLHIHGHLLFAGDKSGSVLVYDLEQEKLIHHIAAHRKPVFDIKSLQKKKELLTASEDGTVAVWSLTSFEKHYRFQVSEQTVRTMAISPDEEEVAFGSKDGYIYRHHLTDYRNLGSFEAHRPTVTALAYHPQGRYLLSGGRDAQIRIWNLPDYQLIKAIPAHRFAVYSLLFHPHLPCFASGSQDKSIKLWDAEDFRLLKIQSLEKSGTGHSHSVNKLLWAADGRILISAGDDRIINLWQMNK